MSIASLNATLDSWGGALDRLEEALADPAEDAKTRDSIILRFLLVFDLSWKAFQRAAAATGMEIRNPRHAFRHAFQQGWIDDEQQWLDMIEDRNLVAHSYNERRAEKIAADVRVLAPAIREAWRRVRLAVETG